MTETAQEETTKETKTTKVTEISFDGIMGAGAVQLATSLSRVTLWREEMAGRFPARRQLSPGRVGWWGPEILEWLQSRPSVGE